VRHARVRELTCAPASENPAYAWLELAFARSDHDAMADIFVSYTSSDRGWAMWIARELKALGHTPHVHEWEIGAGDDIYAWMEARHDAADNVLCVVSDEYLKAPYSTLERNAALWQAAKNRPGFVLFVVVKPCRLPTLSDHFRRCELFGVPEEAARLRFREFIAKRGMPETAGFPGKAAAVSNIAVHVPEHFMGRDDALAAIEKGLGRYEGRIAVTALHGLRGVGKTVLAAAYAERHRADYRATWWMRAESEPAMRADLAGLGVRLGWVAPDEKEEPAIAAVIERLRHQGEGILLIYDNALSGDAIRPYLPRGGAAKVIVTSNAPNWRGVAEPVEIRLWPKETGADFLIARTGRIEERPAAEDLSEALGGLPLAHEQAAAYCGRLAISLAEYRRRFDAAPARLLDTEKDAPAEYHDRLTVAKTFALAIDEAARLHPAAEPLLVHAALLAPEPIPLFLFAESREHFGEPLASALADDGIDEAVAALRAFLGRSRNDPRRARSCRHDRNDPAASAGPSKRRPAMQRRGARRAFARIDRGNGGGLPRRRLRRPRDLATGEAARCSRTGPDWHGCRSPGALPLASQLFDESTRVILTRCAGRLSGGATALRARAGDLREDVGSRASPYRGEPQQPRRPASGPRRSRRGATALRARAGDQRKGARPRPSRYRAEPQ
jgi:TIR domain